MCDKYKEFFRVHIDEERKEIAKYSHEDQIEIYICGVTQKEPPLLYLANYVADNGKEILPLVVNRINKENDDDVKRRLIYLLEVIKRKGYYNIGDNNQIDKLLDVNYPK